MNTGIHKKSVRASRRASVAFNMLDECTIMLVVFSCFRHWDTQIPKFSEACLPISKQLTFVSPKSDGNRKQHLALDMKKSVPPGRGSTLLMFVPTGISL